MKHREFIYVGDTAPNLDKEQYSEFILMYQKAVIVFLKKRNLLTPAQSKCCIEKLEKQNKKI